MNTPPRHDQDRRRHTRTPHVSHLKNIALYHRKKRPSKGIGQDLSLGGMHILCNEPLVQGQLLKVTFGLPWDLGLIESDAQVQWVKKENPNHSVGIKFLKLKPEHLRSIKRYIAEAQMGNKKSFLVEFFSFFSSKVHGFQKDRR